ncbi:MAG: MCP four helix bundle domain-containing protein, partial [Anaerolineae bacterium]|nr:MCP four helix bundle domain-containing protein [Anaerolineae bacterium]
MFGTRGFSVAAKLISGFLAVALIVLAVALVGYLGMQAINTELAKVFDDELQPIALVGRIQTAFYRLRGDLYHFITLSEDRSRTEQTIKAINAEIEKDMERYAALNLTTDERAAWTKFTRLWTGYQQEMASVMTLARAGKQAEALQNMTSGPTSASIQAVAEALDALADLHAHHSDLAHQEGAATFQRSAAVLGVASLIGLALAI